MEDTQRTRPPAIWLTVCGAAFAAAALALLVGLALQKPASAQIKLPSAVTGANCYAVAKSANLIGKHITGEALGTYYAAWVKKLADGPTVTRSTLFDAGIAVSVCLKSKP